MGLSRFYILILACSIGFTGCTANQPIPDTSNSYGKGYAAVVLEDAILNHPDIVSPTGTGDIPGMFNNLVSPPAKEKCCEHCTCIDCTCSYPGECLVKANQGWPVQKCTKINGNDVCVTYLPRSNIGIPYNPYDQIRKDPVRYRDLVKWLPENRNKQSTTSFCPTCPQ